MIDGEFLVYVRELRALQCWGYKLFQPSAILAVKLGLIEKAGMWYTINGISGIQGESNAVEFLIEHLEYYTQLRAEVLEGLRQ